MSQYICRSNTVNNMKELSNFAAINFVQMDFMESLHLFLNGKNIGDCKAKQQNFLKIM